MRTFVGAGELYLDDELLHVIIVDQTLARPWNRRRRDEVKQTVGAVRNVLSCIPRQDRLGEITITVSAALSKEDHQAALDGAVAALESMGLHSGKANMMGLRLS